MTTSQTINLRRVGERRTWLLRRRQVLYEIVVLEGTNEIFRRTTSAPSAVLVAKGRIHTTDSWDWIKAADDSFSPDQPSWISAPVGGSPWS